MGFKFERNIQRYNIIERKGAMSNPLKEIEKKIQEGKAEGEVIDLDLTDISIKKFTPEISALIEGQKNLEVLILSNCGLSDLSNFPKVKLQALDLSHNGLSDDSGIETLATFPELTQVFLGSNNIKELATVMKLKSLTKLIEIDFEGNPVADLPNYSKEVFDSFPAIQYVDRKDAEGNVVDDNEEQEFVDDEDDDDDDEEEYDEEEEDFSEDEEFEEESEEEPKKRGKRRK